MNKRRVRFLDHVASSEQQFHRGEEHDIDDTMADGLVSSGFAVNVQSASQDSGDVDPSVPSKPEKPPKPPKQPKN